MRTFDDAQGRRWQAATMFGSYGEAHLIFSRIDGDDLLAIAMPDATLREADERLAAFSTEELRERLGSAKPLS